MNRDLQKVIKDNYKSFSKGQKRIADYIIDYYEKAAYMTAAKLGVAVNVSESTVVRFADELGYDGYPSLQRAMQEYVRNKLTSVQRIDVTNTLIGEDDILNKILMADAEKIRRTLDEIDHTSFNEAIDKIISAKHIYIIGVRSCSSLAGFLNFNLRMVFDNVIFVQTTSGSEMFEQIMRLGEGDTLIAISFPRYSKRIINAVEFAKKSGADVVALTDCDTSPIAAFADQLLIAQSDMASFVDSLVAPLSIINALIVALAKKKQDELRIRLCELEAIWDEYDVYDKNQN